MIIDARSDVVTLSGRMDKNLWPNIQAAAQLLLWQHPNGILIDASQISYCSAEGAKTFRDALEYIERHHARIVLCQTPECVMDVIRTVPGVRSQVAIAPTCEEARTSLELEVRSRTNQRPQRATASDASPVLVPILQGTLSVKGPISIAHTVGCQVLHEEAGDRHAPVVICPRIHISYILVVPRSLPLNTPLSEEEAVARSLLQEAEDLASAFGLNVEPHVARTRDAAEEILDIAKRLNAAKIVIGIPPTALGRATSSIMSSVLEKSPCEVILTKKEMD